MADHDRGRVVSGEGRACVLQRLALVDRGARSLERDQVGGEPLGRQLEGGAGAGARLVEEVDHSAPAQRRHLLDIAAPDLGETLGAVEDCLDPLPVEILDSYRMLHASASAVCGSEIVTSSTSSISSSRTLTRSPREVGGFLPT